MSAKMVNMSVFSAFLFVLLVLYEERVVGDDVFIQSRDPVDRQSPEDLHVWMRRVTDGVDAMKDQLQQQEARHARQLKTELERQRQTIGRLAKELRLVRKDLNATRRLLTKRHHCHHGDGFDNENVTADQQANELATFGIQAQLQQLEDTVRFLHQQNREERHREHAELLDFSRQLQETQLRLGSTSCGGGTSGELRDDRETYELELRADDNETSPRQAMRGILLDRHQVPVVEVVRPSSSDDQTRPCDESGVGGTSSDCQHQRHHASLPTGNDEEMPPTVDHMTATEVGTTTTMPTTTTSGQLVPAAAAASDKQLSSVVLSGTVPSNSTIMGLAIRNNRLIIYRDDDHSSQLEIVDAATFQLVRRLEVSGLRCVADMASCPNCEYVFIADRCSRMIHVVRDDVYDDDDDSDDDDDDDGTQSATVIQQWQVPDIPHGISVTPRTRNALVTFGTTGKLREYTPTGRLIREVVMQFDVTNARHSVQLEGVNRYAVAHGMWADRLHRVCVVDTRGAVVLAFGVGGGGSGPRQLNTPRHLAMYGRSLIVVDYMNNRVVQLNATSLAFVRELIIDAPDEPHPVRMALDEVAGRLYLASEGSSSPLKSFDMITE